jgi:hypothetical protein
MKKVILTTCILVFTAAYFNVIGQDFSIKVNSTAVRLPEGADGKIEVIIEQGEPEYIYFLYDSEPWQGGNKINESDPTYNNMFVFENLPAGRYFAGAIDNSGKSTFKEVFINEPDE